MVKMDCDLPNTELATPPNLDMKNSIVFIAFAVPIVIDVNAGYGDIAEVERCFHGQATHDRFGNLIVKGCRTVNVHILVTIIDID